jgi:hypothetical protein
MAYLPESLSFTLLAAGELMGTIAFLELAERAERLLRDEPAVLARIRDLLDEILIDEVGHVTYLLGSMGPARLSVVRATAKDRRGNALRHSRAGGERNHRSSRQK